MSSRGTKIKRLSDVIKPYGLRIVATKKHRHILKPNGQSIYSMSSTPSCPYFAENTLRDLVRLGLVPKGTRL